MKHLVSPYPPEYSLKTIALLLAVLICGGCCVNPAAPLYLRDLDSAFLYGPVPHSQKEFLVLGNRIFYATPPFPGELQTIKKLKKIMVSLDVENVGLTELASVLNRQQEERYRREERVPVKVSIHPSWMDTSWEDDTETKQRIEAMHPDIPDAYRLTMAVQLPSVSLYIEKQSLYDTLLQLKGKIPFYFNVIINGTGVTLTILQLQRFD
jgi:hypothetical protein